jgi:hypothetical protein
MADDAGHSAATILSAQGIPVGLNQPNVVTSGPDMGYLSGIYGAEKLLLRMSERLRRKHHDLRSVPPYFRAKKQKYSDHS